MHLEAAGPGFSLPAKVAFPQALDVGAAEALDVGEQTEEAVDQATVDAGQVVGAALWAGIGLGIVVPRRFGITRRRAVADARSGRVQGMR
jgi:hypothetical protein